MTVHLENEHRKDLSFFLSHSGDLMLGVICAHIPIVLLLFCAKELLIFEHLDNTVNFHIMHVQLRTYEAQVLFRRSLG